MFMFLKYITRYQTYTKIIVHLLTTTFLTTYIVNCSWKEKWVFVMDMFICISQSVAVYTGYGATEHDERNMNMGQYYS